MALTHQNTSVSAGTAALAAAAAQSNVRDALVAHPSGAWTLQEEFDSSGSTIHWVVMKCDGALSGLGQTFYVVIGRVAATGAMAIFCGEAYATQTLSDYAPASTSNDYILSSGKYGAGSNTTAASFALGTALPNTTRQPCRTDITAAATMKIVTTIGPESAFILINGYNAIVGGMIDLITPKTGLVATPLIVAGYATEPSSSPPMMAATRWPIAAADAPLQCSNPMRLAQLRTIGWMPITAMQMQAMWTCLYSQGDRYQQDRVVASEIAAIPYCMTTDSGANAQAQKMGVLRGKFRYLRWATGPAAATYYDNIAIDGRKFVVLDFTAITGTPFNPNPGPNGYAAAKFIFCCDTGIAA